MRFVSSWFRAAGAACLGLYMAGSASAAVIVNITEVGSDVQLTLSGSFTSLTIAGSGSGGQTSQVALGSFSGFGLNYIDLAGGSNPNYYGYSLYSKSSNTYWGNFSATADSQTISGFNYLSISTTGLSLDKSYGFGSALSASAIFSNKSIASLGITNPGTYVYTYGNSTTNDTVTFNIGSSPSGGGAVPEPTSMAIFGLGALGFAYRARRKAKA